MGVFVGIGMGILLLSYLAGTPAPNLALPALSRDAFALGSARFIGKSLFTDFVLPFEIAGVLLLAAVIGAVALAKKDRV